MTLVKGLFFKEKSDKSPDFVLGKLSAKRVDLIEFLQSQKDEWVNMDILMSKAGNPYVKIDDFTPEQKDEMMGEEEMKKRAIEVTTGHDATIGSDESELPVGELPF